MKPFDFVSWRRVVVAPGRLHLFQGRTVPAQRDGTDERTYAVRQILNPGNAKSIAISQDHHTPPALRGYNVGGVMADPR
jgi:hypothetical protein